MCLLELAPCHKKGYAVNMADETESVEIKTLPEAMAWGDSMQRAYELEREAHAETLRKLEIERMIAEDFAYWWQRQQD